MNIDLTKPDGLSEAGIAAYETTVRFLLSSDIAVDGEPETDGIFYEPERWSEFTREDNHSAVLIVLHAYGPHKGAFDWGGLNYELMEKLRLELFEIGCYAEQIDEGVSAIYHQPTSEGKISPYAK